MKQPNWTQAAYLKAWDFACIAHHGQTYAGETLGVEYDYINHPAAVAMEVMYALSFHPEMDGNLAVQCALLHDTLEDTAVTYAQLQQQFGQAVADGVAALSKNPELPKDQQMADSLERILLQPSEVWLVKLADRINNLQYIPPHWSVEKATAYQVEAGIIRNYLASVSPYLAQRLQAKMDDYLTNCR